MSEATELAELKISVDSGLMARIEEKASAFRESRELFVLRAVEQFIVDDDYEVETTKRALAEAKAGGPVVENEKVMAWLESWGTENELPPPKCE